MTTSTMFNDTITCDDTITTTVSLLKDLVQTIKNTPDVSKSLEFALISYFGTKNIEIIESFADVYSWLDMSIFEVMATNSRLRLLSVTARASQSAVA